MGGRGRDAAHMERIRAKRAPFTNTRDGRVKRQIRFAFCMSRGAPLTTSQLLQYCYFKFRDDRYRSWHRRNVCRAADPIAIRIGRANGRGRPILWSPRPELIEKAWVRLEERSSGSTRIPLPAAGQVSCPQGGTCARRRT